MTNGPEPGRPLAAAILRRFIPGLAWPTVAEDPDGLLRDAGILGALERRGFRILFLDGDPIAFRFAYETQIRALGDSKNRPDLVVVVEDDASAPPFDLTDHAEWVSLRIEEFFPRLSGGVVRELAPTDRESLFEIQDEAGRKSLGDNESRDFLLRRIFEADPEDAHDDADLLALLAALHYRNRPIPPSFQTRLARRLRRKQQFQEWPLADLVGDRKVFLHFIQERWPRFLDQRDSDRISGDRPPLAMAGPTEIPFDDSRVRAYLDTFFLEGSLSPVEHPYQPSSEETWAAAGIASPAGRPLTERRLELAKELFPAEDADHHAWRHFARAWAETRANLLTEDEREDAVRQGFREMERQVDAAFADWLPNQYGSLASLPPVPPVMLHHVPGALATRNTRVALLVLDGLSLWQWRLLREKLLGTLPGLQLEEDAIFAWLPTLTVVSRQALFAGRPPYFFGDTIQSTSAEPRHWRRFWQDRGLRPQQIGYQRNLKPASLGEAETLLANEEIQALAWVVNAVDDIMHGMQLGERGMANQVRQWAAEGFLVKLLDLLLRAGFEIWLTSDHGNIEAEGIGSPAEGVFANVRGERVRIFADETLRNAVKARFPDSARWVPPGLPSDFIPLLAPERKAFVAKEESVVCHGGAAIEELIVPLVRIRRTAS